MLRWFRVAVLFVVAVSACGDKAADAPPAPVPPPSPPIADPSPAAQPEPPAATIPEAAVKELVDAWLAAQNHGQFEAYAGLYAEKFFGVKRAGQRETRFDRAGWLKDRERMFSKPMTVEAGDLRVRTTSASADVELTQHWTSGKFEDNGPKRLLIVREAGKLKIAQEEMLRSDLVAAKPSRAHGLYFTLTLDSGFYVSLPDAKVPENLGPLTLESGEKNTDVYTVSRSVQEADLEASVRELKSKKLRLEGGCSATVSDYRVMTRVLPHFGERSRWTGKGDSAQAGKPLPPAQVASAAYALGQPRVFAKLSGCTDGRFAWMVDRVGGGLQPLAAEPVEDPALAERAQAAFGKLPSVVAHQRAFLKQAENAEGTWWEEGTEVAIFKHPKSGQVLVSVLAILKDGCSEFSASEWAVFEAKGKTLKRIPISQSIPDRVQDALDVDGDGRLEFLAETDYGTDIELIWPGSDERGTSLEYAYLDCPC